MKHPNQPIGLVNDVIRFKQNKIVNKLLKVCTENGYSLNDIFMEFKAYNMNEDYIQLMQLIGYSVSGYGELENSIPLRERNRADKRADKLNSKV